MTTILRFSASLLQRFLTEEGKAAVHLILKDASSQIAMTGNSPD